MLRAPVNKFLNPKKEAPSNEGASLVSETPPIGKASGGRVLVTVGVWFGTTIKTQYVCRVICDA